MRYYVFIALIMIFYGVLSYAKDNVSAVCVEDHVLVRWATSRDSESLQKPFYLMAGDVVILDRVSNNQCVVRHQGRVGFVDSDNLKILYKDGLPLLQRYFNGKKYTGDRLVYSGNDFELGGRILLFVRNSLGLTAGELLAMEIYARKGKTSEDRVFREIFGGVKWYKIDPSYSDRRLNGFEQQNISFLTNHNGLVPGGSPDGLIMEYRLDGNGRNSAQNRYHASDSTGIYYGEDRFGNSGYAALLSNGTFLIVGMAGEKPWSDQISVSFWVCPGTTVNHLSRIMGRYANDLSGGWRFHYFDQKFHFGVSDGEKDHDISSKHTYSLDAYYHVAGTYNRNRGILRLFVNGQLVAEDRNYFKGQIDYPIDLTIGYFDAWGRAYFQGLVDEVRIYNRELTEQEILEQLRR